LGADPEMDIPAPGVNVLVCGIAGNKEYVPAPVTY